MHGAIGLVVSDHGVELIVAQTFCYHHAARLMAMEAVVVHDRCCPILDGEGLPRG
jgi:hypothetical protein